MKAQAKFENNEAAGRGRFGVTNPLKNAIFGTNLGTMSDLFSGRSSNPLSALAGQSVGAMTVTAASVVVNGGVTGGVGNAVSDLLGKGQAANSNIPATDISAYIRQAAIQRGIDPNIALKVAQSEGGLSSWNTQSSVIKNGVQEQSYGPYQLYMNGGLGNAFMKQTGLNPASASSGPAGVNFALDYAKKNGWGSWYGAGKVGVGKWDGINAGGAEGTAASESSKALDKLSTASTQASSGVGNLGNAMGDASKGVNSLSSGLGSAAQGLNNFGGGLGQFSQQLKSAMSGANSPSSLLGSIGKLLGGVSPTSMFWAPNTTLSSFLTRGYDSGGYTGAGGVYEPAGVVHRGEVVWSQQDVARVGGPHVANAIRLGRQGYAAGGMVDVPGGPAGRASPQNNNQQPLIVNIHNTNGSKVDVRRNDTAQGPSLDVMVDDAVSQKINTPGSKSRRAMGSQFGLKGGLAKR